MKILIVASKFPPEYTGPGVRIPRLYNAIGKELGVERIDVICNGIEQVQNEDYAFENMHVQRRVAQYIRQDKFPFNRLPRRAHAVLAHIAENIITMNTLKGHDPDLIHIVGHSGGTAAALKYATDKNIPVLMELVNTGATPFQRFLFFNKVKPPQNCTIIALNQSAKKQCLQMGFHEGQLWCRPNPIDETKFKAEAEQKLPLRKALTPFDENDIVVCSVAKFMPRKNQYLLAQALEHLPDNYKLVLAGPTVGAGVLHDRDKLYLDQIRQLLKTAGIEAHMHLVTGFVEAAEYIKASDIYAMPAWDEGLGTPMLEAIACGIPVVANAAEPAFQEWIEPGKNGYLCDIESPKAWAKAIQDAAQISQDDRLLSSEKIRSCAGQDVIYKEYTEIIRTLTGLA